MTSSFKIEPLATLKDKIKQPPAAEQNVVPQINSAVLFVGATGSGKSTVLVNLLKRKELLGGAFERIFLISPTAKSDDVQKHLEVPEEDIIDNLREAPEVLEQIMDSQREEIISKGAHKAPLYALVYDDVVGDRDLMKHENFVKTFIACRHYNMTTFLCSQSYTAVPRRVRLQAMNIFYFKGSNSEAELLAEEYAPPGLNKKDTLKLISFATGDKYNFLHINKRVPFEERYRRNLDQVIHFDFHESQSKRRKQNDDEPELPQQPNQDEPDPGVVPEGEEGRQRPPDGSR
jgi:adenylylsulfate kinase-like enzyme